MPARARGLRSRRSARPPAGRWPAPLLAAAVTSAALLAAACSRAPYMPAAPSEVTSSAATQSTGPESARPAGAAYAACMRSNGFGSFPGPSASGLTVITLAAGIDVNSPQFRSAEGSCQSAEPAAAVRIVFEAEAWRSRRSGWHS